jgi:hypothetical protein
LLNVYDTTEQSDLSESQTFITSTRTQSLRVDPLVASLALAASSEAVNTFDFLGVLIAMERLLGL